MDIILKSLVSAVITAIILLISKISGPKLAGALGGVPIVFAISYVLITMQDKTLAKNFLIGGIYGALAGIFFSIILIGLNYQFIKTHWINFAIAYLACFLFALFLVQVTSK
jgi:hypothetical protein